MDKNDTNIFNVHTKVRSELIQGSGINFVKLYKRSGHSLILGWSFDRDFTVCLTKWLSLNPDFEMLI